MLIRTWNQRMYKYIFTSQLRQCDNSFNLIDCVFFRSSFDWILKSVVSESIMIKNVDCDIVNMMTQPRAGMRWTMEACNGTKQTIFGKETRKIGPAHAETMVKSKCLSAQELEQRRPTQLVDTLFACFLIVYQALGFVLVCFLFSCTTAWCVLLNNGIAKDKQTNKHFRTAKLQPNMV